MLKVNTESITNQLKNYTKVMQGKLENMVAGFAENLTLAASEATPTGNQSDLEIGLSSKRGKEGLYASFYIERYKRLGIETSIGYHAGAWKYTEGELRFDNNIYTQKQAVADALKDARSSYKLGDTFFIGAVGPAYEMLAPEISQLKIIYKIDLKQYYDRG